jgi:hypothetical protein
MAPSPVRQGSMLLRTENGCTTPDGEAGGRSVPVRLVQRHCFWHHAPTEPAVWCAGGCILNRGCSRGAFWPRPSRVRVIAGPPTCWPKSRPMLVHFSSARLDGYCGSSAAVRSDSPRRASYGSRFTAASKPAASNGPPVCSRPVLPTIAGDGRGQGRVCPTGGYVRPWRQGSVAAADLLRPPGMRPPGSAFGRLVNTVLSRLLVDFLHRSAPRSLAPRP